MYRYKYECSSEHEQYLKYRLVNELKSRGVETGIEFIRLVTTSSGIYLYLKYVKLVEREGVPPVVFDKPIPVLFVDTLNPCVALQTAVDKCDKIARKLREYAKYDDPCRVLELTVARCARDIAKEFRGLIDAIYIDFVYNEDEKTLTVTYKGRDVVEIKGVEPIYPYGAPELPLGLKCLNLVEAITSKFDDILSKVRDLANVVDFHISIATTVYNALGGEKGYVEGYSEEIAVRKNTTKITTKVMRFETLDKILDRAIGGIPRVYRGYVEVIKPSPELPVWRYELRYGNIARAYVTVETVELEKPTPETVDSFIITITTEKI